MKTLKDIDKLTIEDEDEAMGSDDELRQVGSALESEDESIDRKHKAAYVPPEDINLGDNWLLRDVKVDPGAHHETESEAGSEAESHSESGEPEDEDEAQKETARTDLKDVRLRCITL